MTPYCGGLTILKACLSASYTSSRCRDYSQRNHFDSKQLLCGIRRNTAEGDIRLHHFLLILPILEKDFSSIKCLLKNIIQCTEY
jgi:hypothetical protein